MKTRKKKNKTYKIIKIKKMAGKKLETKQQTLIKKKIRKI